MSLHSEHISSRSPFILLQVKFLGLLSYGSCRGTIAPINNRVSKLLIQRDHFHVSWLGRLRYDPSLTYNNSFSMSQRDFRTRLHMLTRTI